MKAVEQFIKMLEDNDVRCDHQKIGEKDKERECVSVRCTGDNFSGLTFHFIFDDESCNTVSVRCFEVCRFPESKNLTMLQAVNHLNTAYRWVKFYVTTDGRVNAEMNVEYTDESVEKLLFDSLRRVVNVADIAYPVLMKALYV